MLCGGGLGNAVLFSIARALRDNGCRVLYFAGYRKQGGHLQGRRDRGGHRPGDLERRRRRAARPRAGPRTTSSGATSSRRCWPTPGASWASRWSPLRDCQRIIAIGSDRMMAAVARARHGVLRPFLHPEHVAIASINSPMQCMMKEVCAQCLQRQIDPRDRQGDLRLLLLQPGPAAGHRRLGPPGRAPGPEHGAGEAQRSRGPAGSWHVR